MALRHLDCRNNPITQEVTDFYQSLESFGADWRYAYLGIGWTEDGGIILSDGWYDYEDHHGWYYPGEPYSEGHIVYPDN